MSFILSFRELTKKDTFRAGGKGASLGEMTQAGIPVPPGFVLLTAAFEQFLSEAGLHAEIEATIAKLDHRELEMVEKASVHIQELIVQASLPAEIQKAIQSAFQELGASYVAVRSSATAEDAADASWAGELDTYLNTTETDLLEKVQKCWASLFTPRALFYRLENGFADKHVSVAVVVQTMVESEVSGIAFSVHPVTEDYNQLIIEAGYGLGEAIVSGSITPDSYIVDKRDWSLLDKYTTEQEKGLFRVKGGGSSWEEIAPDKQNEPKLNDKEIIKLAQLVVHIERHYAFPCDIEWAMAKGELYILQSRPITTLSKAE